MSVQDVNDIFYFVIQVEKEGFEFYRKLARLSSNAAVKGMFLKLADDEIRHQKNFQELAKVLNKDARSLETTFDLIQMLHVVSERLKTIIKGAELVDMSEVTLTHALDIGIHSENAAIQIYTELLNIKYPEIALVVPKVILEEKKHLELLENLKLKGGY